MDKEQKGQDKENKEEYFDTKKYNTVLVNTGESKTNKNFDSLIELLSERGSESQKLEAYKIIKKPGGKEILLEAIKASKDKENRHVLFAACWETNLDFSEHIELFLEEALLDDDMVTIEATTVIEQMEDTFNKEKIDQFIVKVQAIIKNGNKNKALMEALNSALSLLKIEGK